MDTSSLEQTKICPHLPLRPDADDASIQSRTYDIAAYVWPAFTGDEMRTRVFWPEGMGEWQTVSKARKKFPEHDIEQRRPRWGYVNEADPRVMEMEIDAAADHGVNVFISSAGLYRSSRRLMVNFSNNENTTLIPDAANPTDGSASHPYQQLGRGTSPRRPTFSIYSALFLV